MENVYYSPESWGLSVVAELSKEPDYDFNIICAWKTKRGVIYWATDSGCSCPTPFENHHGMSDLYLLSRSKRELRQAVDRLSVDDAARVKFLSAVGV